MKTHKIYTEGEQTFIERLEHPRFKAEITFNQLSDLENIVWIDAEPPPEQFMLHARILREAGEFIANYKK